MYSIPLPEEERNELMLLHRDAPNHDVRLRAHILLLLDKGTPWVTITAVLFTSPATIARWKRNYERRGIHAISGRKPGRKRSRTWLWATIIVSWVLTRRPSEFGFARSRWCCEAVAVILREDHGVPAGRETVRLLLHQEGLVWRRPRPVVGPTDPDRPAKLHALRALLNGLPDDETAVFMDEVDINLNPKIGSAWMPRSGQSEVATPGNNRKRYLAGSIHWRTGRVILTESGSGEGRTGGLFCRHLDDLRSSLRHYRVIHVLCDNLKTHKPQGSRKVKEYLEQWGHRVKVHYLPAYSPDCNPIERVWWRLHEAVTRNHRCATMEELMDMTWEWFETRTHFRVTSSFYKPEK